MKKRTNITVSSALQTVGSSARRKAFRRKMPVAISENGQTFLLFSDGTRKPVTPQTIQELKDANA